VVRRALTKADLTIFFPQPNICANLRDLREKKIRVKGNPRETCLFGFPDFLV
jgi:hypothetical protein